MPRIRFILNELPDPDFEETAIIQRLRSFYSDLQEKRQRPDKLSEDEKADHEEFWLQQRIEVPVALDIRIRRWATKIRRNHLKKLTPTRLSAEDRLSLQGCRKGADLISLASTHHADEIAAALHMDFPWLSEATTHVWHSLRHNIASGQVGARIAPVLLNGPPGIGKSAWARSLARLLGTPDMIIDATVENASFALVGSQRGWSTAGPGRLLGLMLAQQIANPLVIVDELEKSGEPNSNNGHAFSLPNALLPLVETVTASQWTCPYFQCQFDMSFINWVFTTNSLRSLPAPLLSRIRVISVPSPSQTQVNDVVLREAAKRHLTSFTTETVTTALARAYEAGQEINLRTVKRALDLASDQQNRPILH